MSSKREEERTEKIIRGLMKLPPNRRCINCNSLGPQYVCTNFWTFICMICSGIHREFTHRVKSVSMSKFTAQEVEALQNGGNQRAREIYLKDWDLDRQRHPNSSNVDKIREFIKAVYIDRRYAGGTNSERPPRDMQSQRNAGDETRRASSYHSFSQSPPYDFQYEDRLNRKHTGSLTRKPGSDHYLYERKAASFMYSPGRFSAHIYEDRFANEISTSRVSDYSLSSGGDPFKSAPQSPNLQKDDGLSSPTSDSSMEIVDALRRQTSSTNPDTYGKRDTVKAPLPRSQRTISSGSVGSFEKNSVSFQSTTSGTCFDVYSEPTHSTGNKDSITLSTSEMPFEIAGGLDLFDDALAVPAPTLDSGVNLFQTPIDGSFASMGLFQSPTNSSILSQNHTQTSCSSSSSFISQLPQNPPVFNSSQKLSDPTEPSNEGWATFDLPQPSPPDTNILDTALSRARSEGSMPLENVTSVVPSYTGLLWPDSQHSTVHLPPSLVSNPWDEGLQNVHVPTNMPNSQTWKAFEDGNYQEQECKDVQGINSHVSVDNSSSSTDQFFGLKSSQDSGIDGLEKIASNEGFSFPALPSPISSGSTFVEPMHPFVSEIANVQQKFGNPFDVPFDSESEAHNTFLDLNTLQAALPSMPLPSSYIGDLNDPWFPTNPVASPGGIPYMTSQAASSQLQNVPTQGPVASVGGNPFA